MKIGMRLLIIAPVVFLSFLTTSSAAVEQDAKGSADHPLVTRMPDFYIERYETNEFDSEKFKTADGDVTVEGRRFVIYYGLQPGVEPRGKTQILQNYLNAFNAIGAETKLKGTYYHIFKISKGDIETWVKVDPGNDDGKKYVLTIVERAALRQEVVANADAMAKGILVSGHIAVYGIFFDSGKSVVKDNSRPTLEEIAKLLNNDRKLRLYVVGHTDTDGSLEYNMQLSTERAASVVAALRENYGIDETRLIPKGLGPLAPVASNRTADGKAKNRRVELVEISN